MVENPAIRKQIVEAMGARLLQEESLRIKRKAAETLAKLGDEEAVPYLLAALEHESDEDFFCEIANFIQTIVEGEPQKARSEGPKYDLRGANIGNLADTVQRDQQAN